MCFDLYHPASIISLSKRSSIQTNLVSDESEDKARLAERIRKDELTNFITIILENSSIVPFRWAANKYMCFYCCHSFVESENLKIHTIEEHKGANLKNVLRTLVPSSRIKLDTSEIFCTICGLQFLVFKHFLDHLQSLHDFKFNKEIANSLFTFHLSDNILFCQDCTQEFRFFGTLLRHAHKHHNKFRTFLCEMCGQGFVAQANMVSHMRNVHTYTKSFTCRKCDKEFRSTYCLQVHCEKVHRTDMLKCPKCPEILSSQYFKKRHLALVHDVKKLQFKCDQCDLLFTMRSRLIQHKLRTHLKQRTVACDVCGFKVFNKELLKRHMVRHDDTRPFECEVCEKAFQRKKTLDIHMRIHTNDKRYVCKECGKAFVQMTSLKLHVKLHHGGAGGAKDAGGTKGAGRSEETSWH